MSSGSNGFPPAFRLLNASDFRHVFEKAVKSSDGYLTILARPNGRDHARLGLAISKKSARRAVDRNRIKRLIRECFRLDKRRFPNLDLVVMARPAAALANGNQIRSSLRKHWETLRNRCDLP